MKNPRWSLKDCSPVFHAGSLLCIIYKAGVSIFYNFPNFMMCEIVYSDHPLGSNGITFISKVDGISPIVVSRIAKKISLII